MQGFLLFQFHVFAGRIHHTGTAKHKNSQNAHLSTKIDKFIAYETKIANSLTLKQCDFLTFHFARIYSNFFRMIRLFTIFFVCFNAKLFSKHSPSTFFFPVFVAHSSGFQKLKNSNLKILKFEARFAYAVKFLADFFD